MNEAPVTIGKPTQTAFVLTPLSEIEAALGSSMLFYQCSAAKIDQVALRVLFESMARVRRDFLRALSDEIVGRKRARSPSRWRARAVYEHAFDELGKVPSTQLTHALLAFERSLAGTLCNHATQAREQGDVQLAEVLRMHLLRLQVCLDELERLHKQGLPPCQVCARRR